VGITGVAGFIGSHLAVRLMLGSNESGIAIVWAADSLKPSYGGDLSARRLKSIEFPFETLRIDLGNLSAGDLAESMPQIDVLVHLAAMPGVRGGETHPDDYFQANVVGFHNLLLAAEKSEVRMILYASSSSVYGDRGVRGPSAESDADGTGIKSHYAMTKWINEMQARDFTRRTGIPTVGLRFFTVFGEWGRPDMAYYKFGNAIRRNEPVTIYGTNGGTRNYTYVGDAVEVVERLLKVLDATSIRSDIPSAVNIASGAPISTLEFLEMLSQALGQDRLNVVNIPRPSVDAEATWADTSLLTNLIGDSSHTEIVDGVHRFTDWLTTYGEETQLE